MSPRTSIASAGVLLLLGTGATSSAEAAGPKCFDRQATIIGTAAKDVLHGTRRADVVVARGGNDIVKTYGGNDLVCTGDGNDRVRGGAGSDSIKGALGQDRLRGDDGNDFISGGSSSSGDQGQRNTLRGGKGNDDLLGSSSLDAIRGGAGDDVIRGRGNVDDLYAEVLIGGNGADRITGGPVATRGDGAPVGEVLVGGPGDDTMDGGEAGERLGPLDVVAYSTSSRGVTVNLLDGTATGQGQDTFVNIGGVIGSSFDDIITGDADSNLILGLEGSDAIDAGVGDDLVDGDDHVSANFSIGLPFDAFGCQTVCDDVIGGGEGNDALAGAVGVDLVQGGPGMDTLIGGAGRFGCCNLDASDDIVLGGDGNDDIYGGNFDLMNGHQVSRPHDGDDVLQGDGGDDSLFGQADGDTLDGGPGSNANNGGPGADSCVNPDTVGGATNCESR